MQSRWSAAAAAVGATSSVCWSFSVAVIGAGFTEQLPFSESLFEASTFAEVPVRIGFGLLEPTRSAKVAFTLVSSEIVFGALAITLAVIVEWAATSPSGQAIVPADFFAIRHLPGFTTVKPVREMHRDDHAGQRNGREVPERCDRELRLAGRDDTGDELHGECQARRLQPLLSR